jgi:hypothetical protein
VQTLTGTKRSMLKNDKVLAVWAIVALILIAIVYLLPESALRLLTIEGSTNIALTITVDVVLFVIILGFYLRMFLECGFAQDVHRRGVWLLLFVLLPIFSAFIYFFVTRSRSYKEHLSRVRSTNARSA